MATISPGPDSVSLLIDDEQDSFHNIDGPDLAIRNAFRSVEHEIVRDQEPCSECLGIQEILRWGSWASQNKCCRLSLPELIHRSDTCWFCRFLCRVMAHFLDEEQFKDCQKGKVTIYIHHARGLWEQDLMITTASPNRLATSHLLALPRKASEYQLSQNPKLNPNVYYHEDPRSKRQNLGFFQRERAGFPLPERGVTVTEVRITVDFRHDGKVRKLCKLISDSVQQHEMYFGVIRNLLGLCEGRHKLCMGNVTKQPPLPKDFTLIDTLNRVLVPYSHSKPYVALSYVWGKNCLETDWISDGETMLLGELVQRVYARKSLPVDLPQTIEDAICVTRRISQRYLWVDLLCINQIEPDARDDSIRKMDAIFSRALLTVCVLQGQSMFSGIPGVSQNHRGRRQILTETERVRWMASNLSDIGDVLYTSDWSQRGWTFQEGVLSGRRLCFDTSGVFLHCKEEILHDIVEHLDTTQRIRTPFNGDQIQHVSHWISPEARAWDFSTYARMVRTYSPRTLTFPADAHNAIAGVLSRMTRSTEMSFIGGLPEGDFFNGLLWDYERFGICRRRPQFPSWSWLGWEGSKVYDYWGFDKRRRGFDRIDKRRRGFSEIRSIRTAFTIYFDVVRVQSAASFTFTHTTRDGSNATLRIKTRRALFQVLWRPNWGASVKQRVCWQIVQSNGDPIRIESGFICEKSLARSGDKEYVTVFVNQEVSKKLLKSQSPQIEFVLLQEWTYNETSDVPQIIDREDSKYDGDYRPPEFNPSFVNHVWLMAVASQGDGTYERLDVIHMPARFWNKANPEAVSVDII